MNKIKFSNCSCEIELGKFDVNNIPLNCPATFNLISSGFTTGIFQLESRLGMDWSKKVQPQNIEELAALTALVRPGALESGQSDEYVDIKFGRKKPSYLHPCLKDILGSTYNSMIYQEQSLAIAKEIAGFTMVEADNLRKAIGKKIPELMASLKQKFLDGAVKQNKVTKEVAEQIFEWIEKSQRYSFNKSHAISYGMLTYNTAYIKTHFPLEFFTSYLTFSGYKSDTMDEIYRLVQDARLFGIDVLQPDIRECNIKFKMNNERIRFGLSNIKGVGPSAIEKVVEKGPESLSTWQGFLRSIPALHKNVGEALIKSGACDCYNMHRSQMIKELECIFGTQIKDKNGKTKDIRGLTERERRWFFYKLTDDKTVKEVLEEMIDVKNRMLTKALSSMNKPEILQFTKEFTGLSDEDLDKKTKFDLISVLKKYNYEEKKESKPLSNIKRISVIEEKIKELEHECIDSNLGKATAEKYYLGISLSCSPVDDVDDQEASHTCLDLMKALNGESFSVCAVIDNVKHTKTKKGKSPGSMMCFLTISDSTYSIDHAVVFPDSYEKLSSYCKDGLIGLLQGYKKNGSIIVQNIRKLI